MTWSSLGTVTLTYDWQLLELPAVGTEMFRISQSWRVKPCRKALISQVYAIPYEFFGTRYFYPSQEIKDIELPIPKAFLEKGINTRYLALKMSLWAESIDCSWEVTVDEFI